MNYNLSPDMTPLTPPFTEKQGQYLAFIYAYTQVLGRVPSETDLQRYFQVTTSTVYQIVLNWFLLS